MQGVNTIDNVIDVLSPEEVILAFMCILNEISIVFISESMVNITSAVYDRLIQVFLRFLNHAAQMAI